ncbi:hypothetical protein [Burkholderia gladioli]|uniref:hypothetical protein n=1 Tax=Burkholderia gladioli TaxID=28095 RepID=UPI001640C424|nr:hypothetical protein [Burkholderia gladioli]
MNNPQGMTRLFPGERIQQTEANRPDGTCADVYCTDDYPRDGCSITVRIGAGFVIEMRAPNREFPIEVYGCRNLEAMLLVVKCLASGQLVPKGYNRCDQSGADDRVSHA